MGLATGVLGAGVRRSGLTRVLATSPPAIRMCGAFLWQPNNPLRRFEYPWAFHAISAAGRGLTVLDVGGSLAGMQWVLSRQGHTVINVDPGMAAAGRGWSVSPELHRRLSRAFRADVQLRPTTIGAAGIPDDSIDVLLSISTLEHLTPEDLDEFARHARRVLRADGVAVITVDLYLDLAPFTAETANDWGRNIDVRALLDDAGLELLDGNRAELLGYPEFDPDEIIEHADRYLRGRYPGLAECIVARPRRPETAR